MRIYELPARQTAHFMWAGVALTCAADSYSIVYTLWKKRKQIREKAGREKEARENELELQKLEVRIILNYSQANDHSNFV